MPRAPDPEAGRPAEAVTAFEALLAASPNRLNTLYGAGLAAEGGAALPRVEQPRTFLARIAPARSE